MSFGRKLIIKIKNKWHNSEFKSAFLRFWFWLTIASLFLGFYIVGSMTNNFSNNVDKDIWIVYLVMSLIPIISIILGIKYKRIGYHCKKNIVGGAIVLFLLLSDATVIFETQKAYNNYVDNDYSYVTNLEQILKIDLPDEGKITTFKSPVGEKISAISFSNITFTSDDEISFFNDFIKESTLWTDKVTSYLQMIGDASVFGGKSSSYHYYYLIYNADLKTYNEVPKESGRYHSYCLRYNMDTNELFVEEYYLDFVV